MLKHTENSQTMSQPPVKPSATETRVWDYITNKLTQTKPELGGLPICPYAERYRGTFIVKESHESVNDTLALWAKIWDPTVHTAIVLAWRYPPIESSLRGTGARLTSKGVHRTADRWANTLGDRDCEILVNHPQDPYPVANVWTGMEGHILIILQRLSLLLSARERLQKTNYYQNWSQADLEGLV